MGARGPRVRQNAVVGVPADRRRVEAETSSGLRNGEVRRILCMRKFHKLNYACLV